jgi:hypothetical protein
MGLSGGKKVRLPGHGGQIEDYKGVSGFLRIYRTRRRRTRMVERGEGGRTGRRIRLLEPHRDDGIDS